MGIFNRTGLDCQGSFAPKSRIRWKAAIWSIKREYPSTPGPRHSILVPFSAPRTAVFIMFSASFCVARLSASIFALMA
jgi:hypothetical protein